EAQQPNPVGVDRRLVLDMSNRIPNSFTPNRKVPNRCLFVAHGCGAGPVKVGGDETGEPVPGKLGRWIGHSRVSSSRSVQADNGGKPVPIMFGNKSIVGDRVAARLEGAVRLGYGQHR